MIGIGFKCTGWPTVFLPQNKESSQDKSIKELKKHRAKMKFKAEINVSFLRDFEKNQVFYKFKPRQKKQFFRLSWQTELWQSLNCRPSLPTLRVCDQTLGGVKCSTSQAKVAVQSNRINFHLLKFSPHQPRTLANPHSKLGR